VLRVSSEVGGRVLHQDGKNEILERGEKAIKDLIIVETQGDEERKSNQVI
jgi:hypothetical protein